MKSSVIRDGLFDALAQGSLLLTANRRLARRWRRDFDKAQRDAGRTAWNAPAIRPWSDWLAGEVEQSLSELTTPSSAVERRAWEAAIRDEFSEPLLDIAATARTAACAWALCQQYGLSPRHPAFDAVEDTARFRQWAETFGRFAASHNWLPEASREHWLAQRPTESMRDVWLDGFDEIAPAQRTLLARLPWRSFAPDASARATDVRKQGYPGPREELYSAACWARMRVERGEARSVGIVVHRLAELRPVVESIFGDVVGGTLFNISLGQPLSQWPIAADALRWLRWLGGPLPIGEGGILLRSPFFAGGESELLRRASLDLRWRDKNLLEIPASLARLQGPTILRARMGKALALAGSQPRRQAPAAWVRHFSQLLTAAGWPGDRTLLSAERQAVVRWNDLLREFAAFDAVEPWIGYAEAVVLLTSLAAESIFQPETEEMPIQILETLQAAGARFDGLWVTGLTDTAWPPPAQPNPFLPHALQREANLPHSTPARELAFARRITERLLHSAPEVVFSYPRLEGDEPLRPSRLLASVAEQPPEGHAYPTPVRALAFAGAMELAADSHAPPLSPEEQLRGGTAILARQSQCPFAAFAIYRLRAHEWPEPEPGLTPLERGKALHAALAALWKAHPGREQMAAALAAEGQHVLAAAITAGVAELNAKGRERLVGLEALRMRAVLEAWLELDFLRAEFVVEAVESEIDLSAAGLPLKARIDRIDRLQTGERVVIDYKSGAASNAVWQGERPDDLQLPIYAAALAESPRAIAFAQLKRGSHGFSGFAASADLLPNVGVPEMGWERQKEAWQRTIERLWAEFGAGAARVDPKLLACERCHLHGLCRIHDGSADAPG